MKFVKRNDWEKEWKQTLARERDYLRKNAQAKDSPLQQKLETHIPETLQTTLDSAFCKAFSLIFEKGTGVIEHTYNRKKKTEGAAARHAEAAEKGDRAALRAFHSDASFTAGKNLALSGVEGVGLGLLGIGIPDIPLFTAMMLKSLYELADGYGFPRDTPNEKRFLLQLIETALSHGEALTAGSRALDRYIGLGRWDNAVPLQTQIAQTARCLSGELLYMKFLQGIPIAGAVGGAYDVVYLHRVQRFARIKYHKRFLLAQKNKKEFYQ